MCCRLYLHADKIGITTIPKWYNYQNRNKTLACVLSKWDNFIIQQLEKCHTMMEWNSVHVALKIYLIWSLNAPNDYIRSVCPKQPYEEKAMDYSFFKNYLPLSQCDPEKKQGIHVTNIRLLEYQSNGNIFGDNGDYRLLPQWRI